ncbi:AraC family transcriptional regulator [Sphaerimonospora thailandensis]|uniref:AraC family transcriptional regulator n=1 Tax=Sphaerimonospora thailandensis TaxID=795644 RepID=UPI00194F985B|nr:AraC family transcriptional regulator [Sphaerimonospora thailandensis]
MAAQLLPLAEYERFRTHEIDEACAKVGSVFSPHRLRLVEHGARLDAYMNAVTFDRIGLYCIGYGAEVLITSDTSDSCFFVEIPLVGIAEVSRDREHIVATPQRASVLSPEVGKYMRWAAGTCQLVTTLDRSELEAHLGRMLGRQVHRPLVFSLGMDLLRPSVRSWLSIVDLLRGEAERGGGLLAQPLAFKQLEELLMTQLLLAQPSNYTPALLGEQLRVAPPTVKRALDLIEAHAAEPLTTADIAEAVGVGARALQEGFRRHLSATPMTYLRDVRLDRVRAELTVGAPRTSTVTDIAFHWGFVHLGRFSLAYRQRFGETPSETLYR